ncbi:MAG TPA: hypothetical protein PKA58_12510 [Polyangium sp.]|nr:hypothetical protein [Polyangium sp.]
MKRLVWAMVAAMLFPACGSSNEISFGSGGQGGSGDGGAGGSATGGGGGGGGGNASICTSGTYWLLGDFGNKNMHPGVPCMDCHVPGGKGQKRTFDIAGTVYPTAHEPNDCNGVNVTGATVVITDANGTEHSLPVNSVGNFDHSDFFGTMTIPTPYQAKVVYQGKERVMQSSQINGNCNGCHSEAGNAGPPNSPGPAIPGRIMLP